VKVLNYPRTCVGCGLVLLNVFLFAATATGQLTVNPSPETFGSVQLGNSMSKSAVLSNAGNSSLTIFQATVSGTGFSLSGLSMPLTLAPGQAVSVTTTFAPQSSGSTSGGLSLTYTIQKAKLHGKGSPSSISTVTTSLSGTGTNPGQLTANPNSLNFANVQVGSSQTQSATLTNSGGSSLTVSQATLTGSSFILSGLTSPLTLGAGQSVTFSVVFAPPSAGTFSGNVAFTSDGSNPSMNLPLSGTGVTQGTLTLNPTSLAFGNVQVGNNTSLSETLTNTGVSSLTISAATASGSGFSLNGLSLPLTLTAGQSTSFTVLFSPTASGAASGSVSITSNGSNPNLSIPLSGTGVTPGVLAANPTAVAFGNVQVGNSASLSETLTNTGGSSVTISQVSSSAAAFSISGLTLPLTLTPNQSVTFTASFTPISAGAASGSLSVASNASNSPLSIALSGTGTAAGTLAVSPTSLSFGSVTVGSSSALNGSLTASGASVTVSSASLNNSEFALSGISLPATLPAGQSATFTVTFTPSVSGATSASLSFSSDASNSPAVQTMTGTGAAPTQHNVDLSWSASSGAVGYNVYRGSVSGGPYTMINTSLDGTAAYSDSTVASGQTYYYVATAVDGNANESGYSNEAQAVIPNP
jgi:Abnormal spindle-like microcephaly-assoc'd, ASPM-SPD-2-Hydin